MNEEEKIVDKVVLFSCIGFSVIYVFLAPYPIFFQVMIQSEHRFKISLQMISDLGQFWAFIRCYHREAHPYTFNP